MFPVYLVLTMIYPYNITTRTYRRQTTKWIWIRSCIYACLVWWYSSRIMNTKRERNMCQFFHNYAAWWTQWTYAWTLAIIIFSKIVYSYTHPQVRNISKATMVWWGVEWPSTILLPFLEISVQRKSKINYLLCLGHSIN